MRYASVLALALTVCACGDDSSEGPSDSAGKGGSHSAAGHGGSGHADAGKGDSSGANQSGSGGGPADGGVKDAGEPASKLDRPGTLSRPPKDGLPAELRPPR
jgi:hypothetical protein